MTTVVKEMFLWVIRCSRTLVPCAIITQGVRDGCAACAPPGIPFPLLPDLDLLGTPLPVNVGLWACPE